MVERSASIPAMRMTSFFFPAMIVTPSTSFMRSNWLRGWLPVMLTAFRSIVHVLSCSVPATTAHHHS
ncbi:MAG: hypothetical protein IPI81_11335 [Flavobacteriales bacterium]|nr:hypothetical protein [Flavobacteriales bacterium]